MSQQTDPPAGNQTGTTEPPTGHDGPRVSGDQMRDVDRLRRSTSDRYIAGVAGGLGRHFDIDPTIIRVLLAVLTFFGGAGLLVYAAVWLFVPEDGQETAPVEVGREARRIILLVAGVVALSVVFGTPFFSRGWGGSFPISLLVIGIVLVALYATRDQRRQSRQQPPPPWGSVPAPPYVPEGSTMTATDAETRPQPGQQPPAWMPPPPPAYVPPPRPRRTGVVLFWPTLALIAIALGTLGIFDTSSSVTISAYAALAVGIIGLMLLVGAFVGRPGGLIALGFVACVALLVTSLVGAATGGGSVESKDVRAVPTSAAALEPEYHISTGTIELDLTRISDLSALDGRITSVSVNAGEVTVIVPRGLDVHVQAEVRYAGQINLGEVQRGGLGLSMSRTMITTPGVPDAPVLDLVLDARVGQITVDVP